MPRFADRSWFVIRSTLLSDRATRNRGRLVRLQLSAVECGQGAMNRLALLLLRACDGGNGEGLDSPLYQREFINLLLRCFKIEACLLKITALQLNTDESPFGVPHVSVAGAVCVKRREWR